MSLIKQLLILGLGFVALYSCQSVSHVSTSDRTSPIDSIRVTITPFNLSEDVSGNDEILLLAYVNTDTLVLNDPVIKNRFVVRSKNSARQVKVKLKEDITAKPLIFFLIEQDSEWPVHKIDSVLRVSHVEIRKLFQARNYTGIEKYLSDEDVLGIRSITNLDCAQPTTINLTGIYKLDKYDYQIIIDCPH